MAMKWIPALVLLCLPVVGDDGVAKRRAKISFKEHLIAGGYGYAYGLAAVDLDLDGDVDLTGQDVRGKKSQSSLFWLENDGRGTFGRHAIHDGEPGWFERHATGDLNGDGKPDVAIVNNRDGQILWFANSDRPTAGPWKRRVITTKCPRAYDVALADLDGDGDLDAAAAGYASNLITWYENLGKDARDSAWVQRRVDEKMSEARTIRTGDFNGDGKIDLLAAAVGVENVAPDVTDVRVHGSRVMWYENSGRPASGSWKKHVIDDTSRAPIHGQPVDLDRDGDLDVVMALGMRDRLVPAHRHHVVWYENAGQPGRGREWKRHEIGALAYAFEAIATDLDDDGDTDVVATAWARGDRVVWFENSGVPGGRWTLHVIRENWGAANQVIVADLDGDGRPDIAATADDGSRYATGALEMRWWRNEGVR